MKDELSILTLGAAMSAGGGGGTGDGDMKKAVYDSNDDGIVDAADNANKVNNHTVDKDVPSDAKFTDTVYDDTSISNRVSAIEEVVPSDATSSNKLATQSDLPSAVVGNPSGSSTAGNLSKLQIGSDIYDVPSGGSGNTVSKTRYQISSSSWSSSANADGFYTLTATLNPAIGSSPDVYVAGSADGTQPTDTEKGQFAYVKRCKVNGSTLTLYASSKPSSTFYIWVEGVNGTGSGDMVGNVIQPNGESSGGITLLGEIPITNMTYDSTDDSYGGSFFTTDSTFINAILNSPLLLVKMVGNALNEDQQTNELYVLGSVLTGGNQGWMFGNILRDTFFAGCQSNTYVVGAQTYAVYPRIKAWFLSNKVATDTVKVQFYRVNL